MRPKCYHRVSKTQVRETIFKMTYIQASVICQIPWIFWIPRISTLFRKTHNGPLKIWCRELLFVLQLLIWPLLNVCYLPDVLVLIFQAKSNGMFGVYIRVFLLLALLFSEDSMESCLLPIWMKICHIHVVYFPHMDKLSNLSYGILNTHVNNTVTT